MIFLSVNKDKNRKGKKSSKLETRPKINVTNLYNENEFECDICEEILTSKWSLQNHKLKKHHDILGIGYKCDKCDYTAKGTFINHVVKILGIFGPSLPLRGHFY